MDWLTTFREASEATIRARLRDKPALTFGQWGERYLSNADGSKFQLRPYQVEPAEALFDETLEYVAVRWYSGAGKTYLFAAALCYGAHQLGLQMATMMPAELQAKEWLRDEFQPMLDATGVMSRIGYRKRGDQALAKRWLNGARLRVLGSNSSGELRRLQVDVMMADEVDAYKQDAADEGDKLSQFWKRGRGRQRQFHWAASYPSLRGQSRIDSLLDNSDCRKWTLACVHCSGAFVPHTEMIRMAKNDPATAVLECPQCARSITDAQRKEMSLAGAYVASRTSEGKRGYFVPCLAHVGDHSSAYPSYLVEVATELKKIEHADNRENQRRVFVNTMDAESYSADIVERPTVQDWLDRREGYDATVSLPEGVLLLTVGADVQGDRIEAEVVGHGDHGETWGLVYQVINGRTDRPSTWASFGAWLFETVYSHPRYGDMRPVRTFVDSQFRQKDVLNWTRGKATRGVYAIFGSPIAGRSAIGKRRKVGSPPAYAYELGTNELKGMVYEGLTIPAGEHGHMHFPKIDTYDATYYAQLTAEEAEIKNGIPVYSNVNKLRNEALDVRCYALAARLSIHSRDSFPKLRETLEQRIKAPARTGGVKLPVAARVKKRWV